MSTDDNDDGLNPIISDAKEKFERCRAYEAEMRAHYLDDYKFASGDAINHFQWPNRLRLDRSIDDKPCLTINKVRQHNLQIINDARQNKPAIKCRPTGGGATYASAQIMDSIMRHIEYQSNAAAAYDTATAFMVNAGWGYIRVVTDYVSPMSFDQEIYIRRVVDPLSVYMDPEAKELDKSDAKFAFVFENVPKKEFDKRFPAFKDMAPQEPAIGDQNSWVTSEHVRIVEFYRKREVKDTLYGVPLDGQMTYIRGSELPKEFKKELESRQDVLSREVEDSTIEYFLIIGHKVADQKLWPGKYIPLVPVIAEETLIEGIADRKSHTRAMIDPQRMYNYWASSAVEYGALQTKTPFMAPAQAIEGYESYWNTANKVNHSVLPYNAVDDNGQALPPPERVQPPVAAPVALSGLQIASQEIMMVSGQYEPMMGQPSNERTGLAINERQRQGDNATYHYVDALATAIRCLGKILIDLVPHIYDTRRVLMILAEDGMPFEVLIDPKAKQAYEKRVAQDQYNVQQVFNPALGMYEVEADVGPGYGTRRQEAFEAFKLMLTQAPQLTAVLGDIMFKAGDFPMAEEAAQRLRRMIPPQALGEGPSQTEQQLMMQVQQLQKVLQDNMQDLAKEKLRNRAKDDKHEVDVYKAITQRLALFINAKNTEGANPVSPDELMRVIEQAVMDSQLPPSDEPSETPMGGQLPLPLALPPVPPIEHAKQSPTTGQWYTRDPAQSGRYTRVLQ